MERVAVEDVDPDGDDDDAERRRLSRALGTTDVAINRYRLPPGTGLPAGLHAHADQEEVFVVFDGTVTFETLDGERTVDAGEAIRFAPGEFQSGRNAAGAGGDAVLLALGAPRESDDVRLPLACPACGRPDRRLEIEPDGATFVCPDCGTRRDALPCPECGHDDLRATLGEEGATVVACHGCGATFAEPPSREA